MKIDSSYVGMESARTYRSSSTRKLSVSIQQGWISKESLQNGNQMIGSGGMEDAFENAKSRMDKAKEQEELGDASTHSQENEDALARLKSAQTSNSGRIQNISSNNRTQGVEHVRQQFVLYLWSMFFGQDKASQMADEMGFENPFTPMESTSSDLSEGFATIQITASEEYSFEEYEETSFSSTGVVKTADGREISFGVDVTMSREFSQYYRQEGISVQAMCDPLVINLDNNIPDLSDQKFYFDLDADGEKEEISNLMSGSGFLSLDKNEDGVINDGNELFGTQNGDGFADLAKYDEDGNGWIDESDSVFEQLKIWVKDAQGNDSLYSLKDKNVGAIYLGNQNTDFTLRSGGTGNVNGAIRKTGIFLYEDGMAGTLSHLDMAN